MMVDPFEIRYAVDTVLFFYPATEIASEEKPLHPRSYPHILRDAFLQSRPRTL